MPRPARPPAGAATLQKTVTDAITRAVFRELAKNGYARLSMEAVARRANVGKAALYRRWPSKQDMVVALLSEVGIEIASAPDTGTLAGDLRGYFGHAERILRHPLTSRIIPDLYAEMNRNSGLAAAIRAQMQNPKRRKGEEILIRAMSRGEIKDNIDREMALDVMAGPLYWRLMITREPGDPGYLDRLTSMTLAALTSL